MSDGQEEAYKFYTYAQFMAQEFPPVGWLVDKLIPKPGITIISADPYNYKSWIVLDIARCIATGEPLFGEFATQKGPVIVVNEEDPSGIIQHRLNMLHAEGTKHPFDILISSLVDFEINEASIKYLLESAMQIGALVIIFDSFIRVANLRDENDAVASRKAFGLLKPLTKAGVSIIFTHHHGKAASTDRLQHAMRGSSDFRAAIDAHIAVQASENTSIKITPTKARGAVLHPPFEANVDTDSLNYMRLAYAGAVTGRLKSEEARDAIFSTISIFPTPLTQILLYQAIKELGSDIGKRSFDEVIRKMVSNGEIMRTRGSGNSWLYSMPNESEL